MTAEMETSSSPPTPQNACIENGHGDEALYHDEYVQLALYSLMKNLCTDMDECQTSDTPSTPSTPVDVTDAFQYKLEQAADLVKTHLLFAVREEVDALRGKLSDLEMKIYRLEVENTLLLREYVPPEILARMGPEMADRFIKRRRSSTCCPPVPQVDQQMNYAGSNSLTVPVLATDQARLVEKTPLVGSC